MTSSGTLSLNMNQEVEKKRAGPPDGGYAWFILLSCFLVFGLTFGVIKSFGVLFVEIHQYFETTATETSWITAITIATVHIIAPVASALSTRFSHRLVVMAGGLICSSGAAVGAYADNLTQLYLSVGLLNGLGYGLTWTPTATVLGLYFQRRRPMAYALASAGECILTFVLTPLLQLLIDTYSWRGALFILGGLQLHLCLCGALLRPLPSAPSGGEGKGEEEEEEGLAEELLRKETKGPGRLRESQEGSPEDSEELRTNVRRYADYTLIYDPHFLVYSMFGVFAALGFFAPALFLVPYARSRGITEYQAAALMSISAAMDLLGRVFFGWVANLRLVETVQQLTATVTLLGCVLLLCPLASSLAQLAAFSVAFGLVYGATVAVHLSVLAEVVGVHRLGSALGFFMLIRSSGALLGPPIAGYFIDKMGNYATGFVMAGVALIVSALFLLLLHQMTRRGRRSTSDNVQIRTKGDGDSSQDHTQTMFNEE